MGFTIQTPQEPAMAPLVPAVALGGAHLDQLCRACAEGIMYIMIIMYLHTISCSNISYISCIDDL
jgi:hypothetical protein